MQFSKIARIAKQNKTVVLMCDKDGTQWINTGASAYRLEGMPMLDKDTVLTVIGVADDAKEKWYAAEEGEARDILQNDYDGEEEITVEDAGISIVFGGHLLTPIYTMTGLIWIDTELLKPTDDKSNEYRRFFIRNTPNGHRAIAVKKGLILQALIMEFEVGSELYEAIGDLFDRCRAEAGRKGERQ